MDSAKKYLARRYTSHPWLEGFSLAKLQAVTRNGKAVMDTYLGIGDVQ